MNNCCVKHLHAWSHIQQIHSQMHASMYVACVHVPAYAHTPTHTINPYKIQHTMSGTRGRLTILILDKIITHKNNSS